MKFLKALAVFLGTIIGVGIFGLPFIAFKVGFFVLAGYFVVMSMVAILINIIYARVILGTDRIHRFPGYVQEYLGSGWKKFSFFIMAIGLIGALLAYLIVGGNFLFAYFGSTFGGSIIFYTLIFFIIGAFLVHRGVKSVSSVELILLCFLFFLLVAFFVKAFPFINVNNFKGFDLGYIVLPYGVILFSLWGTSVIPEIKEMLGSSIALKKVIVSGIVLSAMIYVFFIYIIQGASSVVSEDAISGLEQALGSNVIRLGFLFGVITCFTSFIALSLTLKKVLWYDFGLNKNLSWFLTSFIPLGLFFLGFRKFIEVISLTGAVALGIEAIIIVFLYKKFLAKKIFQKMNPLWYLLAGVFVLGIVLEFFLFYARII